MSCRHPSIRTLRWAYLCPVQVGCYSVQPVLPPVPRPRSSSLWDGSCQTRKTQSPNSAYRRYDLGSLCSRQGRLMQWLVHLSSNPKVVEDYCQLPGHSDDGSLLAERRTTCGECQSPSPQVTISSEWSENMMSTLNEQRTKIRIAFLRDVQLRLRASRVAACRLQAIVAARIAALGKAVRIFESQDVSQRYERAHAMNLSQQRNFRV